MDDLEVTAEQEIASVFAGKPHVVLLGAGASRAALPNGDKNGRTVPLLREVAADLNLVEQFPDDLRDLAVTDFEAAYSQLWDRGADGTVEIEHLVRDYFSELELPETPTIYDALLMSLREKDAIFTFNWDPLLIQSEIRLGRLGAGPDFPPLFFLHGNVVVGFCRKDQTSGLIGQRCTRCGELFEPSRLLFPVERKNYQDGGLIEREWQAMRHYLKHCFMFTIFGYSAPTTDVEAIDLLRKGWGDPSERNMEQTEIINRPGLDEDGLRNTWKPFIHTHHYEIHDSFYGSWLGNHPRRSGEAYFNQYIEAKFISDNPIPSNLEGLRELVDWFAPLRAAEQGE
jgi:hypothetical protein